MPNGENYREWLDHFENKLKKDDISWKLDKICVGLGEMREGLSMPKMRAISQSIKFILIPRRLRAPKQIRLKLVMPYGWANRQEVVAENLQVIIEQIIRALSEIEESLGKSKKFSSISFHLEIAKMSYLGEKPGSIGVVNRGEFEEMSFMNRIGEELFEMIPSLLFWLGRVAEKVACRFV